MIVKSDEDALICDLAEVYHIYDYRRLPLTQVAVFAYGLPEDSRTKRNLSGQKVPLDTMLLAAIFDQFNALIYGLSGGKNNRPQSLTQLLLGETDNPQHAFTSSKDFENERQRILNRIRKEGTANGN